MENETWQTIPGYGGKYEASTDGNIRNAMTGRPLAFSQMTNGYWKVHLDRQCLLVHRTIMLTFVGPPPDAKSQVNHLDLNKSNNRPSNLEYVSRAENMRHAIANGCAIGGHNRRLTEDQVRQIRDLRQTIGPVAIAKQFGITKSYVVHLCKGTRRGALGASSVGA